MSGEIAVVTGANGYIGSHVVKLLLERGYFVRATVRDVRNDKKTAHLLDMDPGGRLQLFSADLLKEGSFDASCEGADFVFHIAAPVMIGHPNPQKAIVEPAVSGMKNIISAVEKSSDTIKNFVMTSSVEVVCSPKKAKTGHRFTAEDWNEDADINQPYPYAKRLSEEVAVELFKKDSLKHIRLSRICPALVTGPVLSPHVLPLSLIPVEGMGSGYYPFVPDLYQSVTDVRNVAEAHVNCVEIKDREHDRYIIAGELLSFVGMNRLCLQDKRTGHLPWSQTLVPNIGLYLSVIWDERISVGWLKDNLGVEYLLNSSPSVDELEIDYISAQDSLVDSVLSLQKHGLMKPRYSIVTIAIAAIIGVLFLLYLVKSLVM